MDRDADDEHPNVDTLYSLVIYDLSAEDVVLKVPDIPDSQYALFSVRQSHPRMHHVLLTNVLRSSTTHMETTTQTPVQAVPCLIGADNTESSGHRWDLTK